MPSPLSPNKSGERIRMIAEAAYFRAEKRGFEEGHDIMDWIAAEEEIDRVLLEPKSEKEAFRKRIEAQIADWDVKLDALKKKAGETGSEIRNEIEALAEKRTALQTRLQELAERSGEVWKDLKVGTEKAGDEMRKAFDRIASRFK